MDYFEDRIAEDRRRRRVRLIVLAVIAAAFTAAIFFWLRRNPGALESLPAAVDSLLPGDAEPPVEVAEATPTPEPTPEPTLPPVAEEALDEAVRRLVGGLSSNPALVRWLATEGLVRRFVVGVANVAEGKSPRQGLLFLDPREEFVVREEGERLVVDASTYRRYDVVAEAIGSVDVAGVATAFEELEPRLDEAYRELGEPRGKFRDVLREAIRRLLRVPVPRGEIEVRPKLKSFRFGDERYEARSAAEKHLLRMGPENMRKVQAKLDEIARALELG